MVGVGAKKDSTKIALVGHGLVVADRFELSPGVHISSALPFHDLKVVADAAKNFVDYAAAVVGGDLATFCLEIEDSEGGDSLARKGWNSLWTFHLLSIACRSPCFPLFSVSDGSEPVVTSTNRNVFVRRLAHLPKATSEQLTWAKEHSASFDVLRDVPEFSSAVRCYGNAHYLPDAELRIMLLWAGIEGLLGVDAELNRRLALYAALMLDETPERKAAYFDEVRQAYGIRSRAVHGARLSEAKMGEGYRSASKILVGLLARCVELGRVPKPAELDKLAVAATVR